MSREEAIRCLNVHSSTNGSGLCTDKQHYEAKQMAIKALSQEPTTPMSTFDIAKQFGIKLEPCDDAISREDAIISINKLYEECEDWRALNDLQFGRNQGLSLAIEVIEDLPSVTQKLIECDDAISREWLMRKATERFYTTNYFNHISAMIEEAPSVTQKSGKWQRVSIDKYIQHAMAYYECSECGGQTIGEPKFCPNCGAKMESEEV